MERETCGLEIRSLILLLGICYSLSTIPASSIGQISFERSYGGADVEYGISVQQTKDRGYVIGGVTWPLTGKSDIYLLKTDSLGDLLWDRVYGGAYTDNAKCVQQTLDGGFVITGETQLGQVGYPDLYLLKTDSLGSVLWDRRYGGSYGDGGESVHQTPDGGYVIAGYTSPPGGGGLDVYLIKTDTLGDILWDRTYGGLGNEKGHSVQQAQDGGYVIAGWTSSFGAGGGDVYLVKTDSSGNTLWEATYGGSNGDFGRSLCKTMDGGYIIAGETWSFGSGDADVYLVKTDSLGGLLWETTYGGDTLDYAFSVQQTRDGGYVIVGWTFSFGAGGSDLYFIKTDPLGNALWDTTYGGDFNDAGYSVQQTLDGGYVITGLTGYLSLPNRGDVYLIKTPPVEPLGLEEGRMRFSVQGPRAKLLQSSPNPFRRSTEIAYSLPVACHVTLSVYDVSGRPVRTIVEGPREPGVHRVLWDAKELPGGVYFCKLQAGDFRGVGKMILLR